MTREDKLTFRRLLLDARAKFTRQYTKGVSEAITKELAVMPIWRSHQTVHVYLPIKGEKNEISTWAIVDFLFNEHHEVWTSYLPKDRKQDGYSQITPKTTYSKGRYDIPLPDEKVEPGVKISTVIVPCLAADLRGNRIGYGSGWYDWFLEQHPGAYRVGLVYDELLFDKIPSEAKDEKLDCLISENRQVEIKRVKS